MKKLFKNKILLIFLVLTMVLGTLAGCTTKDTSINEDEEIVLAAARDLSPGAKDAYYATSILFVWEPLIGLDDKGNPCAELAEKWTNSEDFKEWTFKIKEGVKFHDGVQLDADAVIKNFDRYMNMKTKGSPFYSFDLEKTYPNLKEVVKVSDYEVKLIFNKPISTLIYNMARFGSAIYSPQCFDINTGDFTDIAKGTGPFKIVEHEKDQYTLLERNEEYYGDKAKAKKVRVKVIPDAETRFSALKSEEIMGVMDLGAITPELSKELLKDKNFDVSTGKSSITHFISTNGVKGPFSNAKMKEALSLIVDRDLIVDEFFGGYGTSTINILNHTSPFAKEIKPVHDKEGAKEIAKEVLKGETKEVKFIVPSYGVDRYPYKPEAEYIQSAIKDIGLNATITILDGAAFKEAMKKGEYDLAIHPQGLPNAEPFTIFEGYMHSKGSSNKSYSLGYKNQRVDELIDKLKETNDITKREEIYNELQDISAKDPASIPLFQDVNLIAFNKKIKGFEATSYGTTLNKMEWSK